MSDRSIDWLLDVCTYSLFEQIPGILSWGFLMYFLQNKSERIELWDNVWGDTSSHSQFSSYECDTLWDWK